MGFFSHLQKQKTQSKRRGPSLDFLHQHQCNVCPLRKHWPNLKHPHMEPHGSRRPVIYILGEGPGAEEDRKGIPFVGRSGQLLHFRIPEKYKKVPMRWGNVVRTRPPNNRTPELTEIECCRPSVEADIEQTKPVAIFGFGGVPLNWATGRHIITLWNGRKTPVKIGSHTCWFYPMLHPSFILRDPYRKFEPRTPKQYPTEMEFTFQLDLTRAFKDVMNGPGKPHVWTEEEFRSNTTLITGHEPGALGKVTSLVQAAIAAENNGFDYETTGGFKPYRDECLILSAAICYDLKTFAFAIDHKQAGWSLNEKRKIRDLLRYYLYHKRPVKICHGAHYEMEWSAEFFGPECLRAGEWRDTITQAYVLDERGKKMKDGPFSLDFLCRQHLGIDLKVLSSLDRDRLAEADLDEVLPYNGMDSKGAFILDLKQMKLIENEGLKNTYAWRQRSVPTMVLTTRKGIPIHQPTAKAFYTQYIRRQQIIEQKIAATDLAKRFKKVFGKDYRPSATQDAVKAIRQLLKIQIEGSKETDLAPIKDRCIKLTLVWRKLNKQISTYIRPALRGAPELYPGDLWHPSIKLTDTRTGRTSSDGPNSQNVTKRGKHAKIRQMVQLPRRRK